MQKPRTGTRKAGGKAAAKARKPSGQASAPQAGTANGPVLILASRESGGSLLATLLGGHPAFYGAPHLNILAFDEVWQCIRYGAIPRDPHLHGLWRYLGMMLTGEQSIQSVQSAQRWLNRRSDRTTAAVHAELRSLAAPRRLVDYSPLVAQNDAAMARAIAALPDDTTIIHLTRDPRRQGRAMCLPVWQSIMTSLDFWDRRGRHQACMDVFEIGEQFIDWSVTPPVFDPQFAWHRTQAAARAVLADLPPGRWLHLDLDALMAAPDAGLAALLDRLGADAAPATIAAMQAAGLTDYTLPGPYPAPFGVDFEMIGTPVATALGRGAGPLMPADPEGPLPWRGDGEGLLPEVRGLAHSLGHATAAATGGAP